VDTLLGLMVIGGVVYFLLTSGSSSKKKRKNTSNPSPASKHKAAHKYKSPSNLKSSSSRGEGWVPTYDGPMFAQPGEVGELFSYASYSGEHSLDAPFAIIDFETSGFEAGNSKVLEVAVVKIDLNGKVLGSFSTLINPGDGEVGRTDIHHISLSMVKNAPLMSEVICDLVRFIDSSVIVAHNAKFEERFLNAALLESGINLRGIPAIDTLWLSRQVIKLPNYKLATVIEGFGETIENAHTAMGDVLAMTKILPPMLKMAKPVKYPSPLVESPSVKTSGKLLPRS
jgi:DNA polymerase III epsilon subunit-like protein